MRGFVFWFYVAVLLFGGAAGWGYFAEPPALYSLGHVYYGKPTPTPLPDRCHTACLFVSRTALLVSFALAGWRLVWVLHDAEQRASVERVRLINSFPKSTC